MSAKTFAADSGGAIHRIKKVFAADTGGVIRKIKKIFAADSGGVIHLVFVADDELSMLVGTVGNNNGYAAGGVGTLTPGTLGDGAIVQEILVSNHAAPTPGLLIFFISNYPGTITSAYLTSLMINAALYKPSDANFTGFSGGASGGSAQWTWSGAGIPTPGTTIPVVITRT